MELLDVINVLDPTDADYERVEILMCRLYKDHQASSLNTIRMRSLLTMNKPDENPPTSNVAMHHISWAFLQASKWVNASVAMYTYLSTPVSSGGSKRTEAS